MAATMNAGAPDARIDADRLWGDLMALAEITDPQRPYTRRSFSPTFLRGRAWLADRYRDAGLTVRVDAAGNLIGRRAGSAADAPAIVVGSHSDSVPGGGRFDGIAGVVAGLEVARALADGGIALAHPLEVVDFLAEEPSEFGVSCIGSRAVAGLLDAGHLAMTAPGGETLAQAIERTGGDPARIGAARRADIGAFLELHIEQGPVLEARGIDLGIVTAIVGITRVEIRFAGEAAHAGTVPMNARRDAAVAAAEAVLAVRDLARGFADRGEGHFVATCGVCEILPNASNVVPGQARVVVDARSERAEAMSAFVARLEAALQAIARGNDVALAAFRIVSGNDPAACDAALQRVLQESAERAGYSSLRMASGAGHDAAYVAHVAPAAMLFVPSRGGRSHCPEEWTGQAELAAGAQVMLEAVRRIDGAPGSGVEAGNP